MASAPETVTRVFPNPALTAAASLLDSQREMFGEPHAAFHRRLDAINQVFDERVIPGGKGPAPFLSAPELAAADIIALGKALPTSGNKPLVLAHAIMTIAALATVAELQAKIDEQLNPTKDIGKQIADGTFPTFRDVSVMYDTPAEAREKGSPEHHIQEWCRRANVPYIAPAKGGERPKAEIARPALAVAKEA